MPALDAYRGIDRTKAIQVQAYDDAEEEKRRKVQAEALLRIHQENQDARAAAQDTRAQAEEDRRVAADHTKAQLPVMQLDASDWVASHPDFQTGFAKQPEYVRKHFSAYDPSVAAEAPQAWDKAVGDTTGHIPGLPPELSPTAATVIDGKAQVHYSTEKPTAVPADVRSELIRLNAWKDGMTPEEAGMARDEAYLKSGVIPERYQKTATTFAGQISKDNILAPFAKQKEAYDTMRSGFENPQSGGFSDMAMIEGFQRIVNPGAVVRQQTMNQMLAAAGLAKYGSWDYLVQHVSQGDKLDAAARQRLMALAEQTFNHAKTTASRELSAKQRYAKTLGIPNPEAFVNNVLDYVAQNSEPDTPAAAPVATPQTPGVWDRVKNVFSPTTPEVPHAGAASTIPPAAAAHLKANPSLAPQFDEWYGVGSAAKILGQ